MFHIFDWKVTVTVGTHLRRVELPNVDDGDIVSAPRGSLLRPSKEFQQLLRPRCCRVAFASRVKLSVSEGDYCMFVVREIRQYLLDVTAQRLLLVNESLPSSLLAFMTESEGEDAVDGP